MTAVSAVPPCYRIEVRNNLVVAIEPLHAEPSGTIATTPLQISTELARNHQTQGCLDGSYLVRDAEMARQVAALSLDFMAKIVEKSLASLNAATLHETGWKNPYTPP